jgi:transcriptional regulator with XRE-family HTH domain
VSTNELENGVLMAAADRRKDSAARIRAARAYAHLSQPDLAGRLGVSLATMKRIEGGQRPISTEELIAIAEACDVPTAFMFHGFGAPAEGVAITPDEFAARLAACERQIADYATTAERIESHYRRLLGSDAD